MARLSGTGWQSIMAHFPQKECWKDSQAQLEGFLINGVEKMLFYYGILMGLSFELR